MGPSWYVLASTAQRKVATAADPRFFLPGWVVAAEQFPLKIAPLCVALATASNWLNNFIIGAWRTAGKRGKRDFD